MANETSKQISDYNADNVLREIFNTSDDSITTSSFITAKIGYKITRIDTAGGNLAGAAAGDDFSFYDGATLLYTIRTLFTDSDKQILASVERVA